VIKLELLFRHLPGRTEENHKKFRMADHALIPHRCHRRLKCTKRTRNLILTFLKCAQVHPDLRSYVSECSTQVEFCVCGNSVFVWSTIYVSMYLCMYVYMYVQGSPVEVQTPTHWNQIGCNMTPPCPATATLHRQCYRPAVFRHLRLIALSFPNGKIRRAFRECHIILFTFFFKPRRLKSRNLKLHYVGSVCILLVSFKRSICYRRRIHGNAECSILAAWKAFCPQ